MQNSLGNTPMFVATRSNRVSGFTLIEIIIVIVLLGLIGTVGATVVVNGVRAMDHSKAAINTLGKLRYAVERMAREIRETRRDPSNPGQFDITTMTSTSLVLTKIDGTEVTVNATPPLVTLAYSSPAVSATLSDQLGTLQFKYYQADGITETSSAGEVVFVQISASLVSGNGTYQQTTRVTLRNQR